MGARLYGFSISDRKMESLYNIGLTCKVVETEHTQSSVR